MKYISSFLWFCACMLFAPIMWVLGELGAEKAKELFQLIKAGKEAKKAQETEQ